MIQELYVNKIFTHTQKKKPSKLRGIFSAKKPISKIVVGEGARNLNST